MELGAVSTLIDAHCPVDKGKDQDIFMCKYSIIVPVYKVEKELPRCIESILNQTLTDFELILVDDGSPDGSGMICDRYATKDPRIHVIHQENGGVSRARNAGLDIAAGRYVVFIDSDDFVENKYLETFDADDSDLVVSCTTVYEADGHIKETTFEADRVIEVSKEDDYINFLKKWYALQVCGKRFKHLLIGAQRFDETFKYGEDSIFVAQYLLRINNLRICSSATYNYCLSNAESLTKQVTKTWFVSYSALQEKLFNLFDGHEKTQQYLAEKFCWVAEKEIIKICSSEQPEKVKRSDLLCLLNSDFFLFCMKKCKKNLSIRTRVLFNCKSPRLILLSYKFLRENSSPKGK